jgi:hypothetical protein
MKNKKIIIKNHAVAGVIEALLMVALVSIIISMIQLIYIPDIMEQREAEHMDQISNQFSTIKSMMEMQAITESSASISTMLTLGSSELPYFITVRSYGEASVRNTSEWSISIDGANPGDPYFYDLTAIQYQASNAYFVDQTYILEGGGIIVKQPKGESVMRVDPSITVENKSIIKIRFNLPIFVGITGKSSTIGSGKCFIRTNWSRGGTDIIEGVGINTLNISTQYPNAWNNSLYDMFGNNVNYEKGESYVKISKMGVRPIYLYLEYYYIYVQIGHGWIK